MKHILKVMNAPDSDQENPRCDLVDIYDLPSVDLSKYKGIIVAMGCDQVALKRQRENLSRWVRDGGKLLANGLPMCQYLDGLPTHRKLEFHGLNDVWLWAVEPHPIWEGIDRQDILLRTGVPGHHSFEELTKIGVAGFYARSFLADLPPDATVITGIGAGKLPVDVSYRIGTGEVIVHNGNDLTGFAFEGTSAENLDTTIYDYLEER